MEFENEDPKMPDTLEVRFPRTHDILLSYSQKSGTKSV